MTRNTQGQFIKGEHWRTPKPYWDRDWLISEYVAKGQSAAEIAVAQGCHENNILYFLHKFDIPTRDVSQVRAVKHWGASGPDNPMFGMTGELSPSWRGGICPERQHFYSSLEWKAVFAKAWLRYHSQCARCGKRDSGPRSLHVHHIVPVTVKEKRAELDNLVLLCSGCHGFVHSKANVSRELRGD